MASDILNIIISSLSIIISIIFFITIVFVAVEILKIYFNLFNRITSEISGILSTSIKLIGVVIEFVLTVMGAFIIITAAFWIFVPNSLYLDLNTNNHDFEFGMPAVAFSGTYEDTSSGYLMLPNLPFSLLVIPKLPITKTDKTHLNIIGLKFKESGPNQPGVTTFVPDRG